MRSRGLKERIRRGSFEVVEFVDGATTGAVPVPTSPPAPTPPAGPNNQQLPPQDIPTGQRTAQQEMDLIIMQTAVWRLMSHGWSFNNQCYEQAKSLRDHLLTTVDPRHWDISVVGRWHWILPAHHHVVVLSPKGTNQGQDWVVDAYKDFISPWDWSVLPYTEWVETWPYPGDTPHPNLQD